jgi:hypothetical protein
MSLSLRSAQEGAYRVRVQGPILQTTMASTPKRPAKLEEENAALRPFWPR